MKLPRRFLLSIAFIFAAAVSGLVAQPAATPALSAQDYAEIISLYARYPLILDSGDAEGYADLFTADGSFNAFKGRAALVEFVKNRRRSSEQHVPMFPEITPTADGARGTVLNLFIDIGSTPPVITRATRYSDVLVKTAAGWRFQTRTHGPAVPGSATPAPAAPAAAK